MSYVKARKVKKKYEKSNYALEVVNFYFGRRGLGPKASLSYALAGHGRRIIYMTAPYPVRR